MAFPLILIVAPNGSTKDAVAFLTPSSFSTVFIVTGSVAMDDAVERATA